MAGKAVKKKTYKKKPNGKNDTGRPCKYQPEYCDAIIIYFDVPAYETHTNEETGKKHHTACDLPLFSEFAREIGVCVDSLHEWQKEYPEFSEAYKKAKELQQRNWIQCSMLGLYNPAFTIFFGKNIFKWTDKQDLNVTMPTTIKVIYDDGPGKDG